jgi:predicted HTH transcriptional regulator
MKKSKTYDLELKTKVLKEYEETSSLSEVSRQNNVPVTTVRSWILKRDGKKSSQSQKRQVEKLQKELPASLVENQILKELLKKTNQAWLKD